MGVKMEINNETKFGFCKGCEKWKPRDEMRGINANVFGTEVHGIEEVVRVRLCPECFREFLLKLKEYQWEGLLYEAREIATDEELARNCDEISSCESQSVMLDNPK